MNRLHPFNPQEFFDSLKTEVSPGWPVVVIDFNGVLDQYVGWRGKVETFDPAPGAHEFLEKLRDRFNTIVVCSATMPIGEVIAWMFQHGFNDVVDYVTNHKPPAAVYIDDRAVTHQGNFDETLEQVLNFKPFWQR